MSKSTQQEIARLRRENARLRRENDYLNHRIERLFPKEAKNITRQEEMFLSAGDVDSYSGYFQYIFSRFKFSHIYRTYDRIFFTLRKIILASKIWRWLPVILSVLGIVLQSILALGSAVLILPILFVASLVFLTVSTLKFARHRKKLLEVVSGQKIYFLFPAKKPRKDGFFYETMQTFAKDGVVFAVTPSFGLTGPDAVQKIGENVYFIHTSFYYNFHRAVEDASADVVKIY